MVKRWPIPSPKGTAMKIGGKARWYACAENFNYYYCCFSENTTTKCEMDGNVRQLLTYSIYEL